MLLLLVVVVVLLLVELNEKAHLMLAVAGIDLKNIRQLLVFNYLE